MQFTPSEHKAKKNQLFTKEQGTEVKGLKTQNQKLCHNEWCVSE
jgi:hypothetical protein